MKSPFKSKRIEQLELQLQAQQHQSQVLESTLSEMKKQADMDKAVIVVNNAFNADKELASEPDRATYIKILNEKTHKEETRVQLSDTLTNWSVEGMLDSNGSSYMNTYKYWNYYISTGVIRKCINLIAGFTARAGFETTIKCLDEDDSPDKPEYIAVKKVIDDLNRKVNMDNVLFVTQVKRWLYGMCSWQIVPGKTKGNIEDLQPMQSGYIQPVVDPKTGQFSGVEYWPTQGKTFPAKSVLFFNLDSLENNASDMQGVSSVRSIERELKIKKNLQRDLLYAARSLWAPIVIFQADTRGMTPTERTTLMESLKSDLRPGGVVVTNRQVTSTVIQYNPDLNNLIRAIQLQDEDIIGNYGIPKALLSREKTETRATLEFSIKAFFESTISQEQQYLKRQLEKQWYDPIVQALGYADRIRIRHEWKPILDPASDLIVALTRAYDSGIISGDEFFRRLGWELDRVVPEAEEPGSPEFKPPTTTPQQPTVKKPAPSKGVKPNAPA